MREGEEGKWEERGRIACKYRRKGGRNGEREVSHEALLLSAHTELRVPDATPSARSQGHLDKRTGKSPPLMAAARAALGSAPARAVDIGTH